MTPRVALAMLVATLCTLTTVASASAQQWLLEHQLPGTSQWTVRGSVELSSRRAPFTEDVDFAAERQTAEFLERLRSNAVPNAWYRLRLVPTTGGSIEERTLQTALPAKNLSHVVDFTDQISIALDRAQPDETAAVPVALNYRVTKALGLSLFTHTGVRLTSPGAAPEPHVGRRPVKAAQARNPDTGEVVEEEEPSMIRKYWWVGLMVLVAASQMMQAAAPEEGGKKKA